MSMRTRLPGPPASRDSPAYASSYCKPAGITGALLRFVTLCMSALTAHTSAGQKRAPDPITDDREPPCGCWDLNSGPSEQQSVLLTG